MCTKRDEHEPQLTQPGRITMIEDTARVHQGITGAQSPQQILEKLS
jgi:hypothetical protein